MLVNSSYRFCQEVVLILDRKYLKLLSSYLELVIIFEIDVTFCSIISKSDRVSALVFSILEFIKSPSLDISSMNLNPTSFPDFLNWDLRLIKFSFIVLLPTLTRLRESEKRYFILELDLLT